MSANGCLRFEVPCREVDESGVLVVENGMDENLVVGDVPVKILCMDAKRENSNPESSRYILPGQSIYWLLRKFCEPVNEYN